MRVSKTLIAAAVAALIPLGAAALAGDGDYGSKDKAGATASFKQLDTNKDGKISQAEAAVDSTIVFSTADTNGDGYIDSAEWKAAQSMRNDKSRDSSSPQSMPSDQAPPDTQQPSTTPKPDTETPPQ